MVAGCSNRYICMIARSECVSVCVSVDHLYAFKRSVDRFMHTSMHVYFVRRAYIGSIALSCPRSQSRALIVKLTGV